MFKTKPEYEIVYVSIPLTRSGFHNTSNLSLGGIWPTSTSLGFIRYFDPYFIIIAANLRHVHRLPKYG